MSILPLQVLRCGDDWPFSGPLNDPNGNPLPLTGASIIWKLDSLDFSTNIITQTAGNGITVTNTTTATVEYGPTAEETADFIPGTYYQTLRVTLSAGNGGLTFTVLEGLINAMPDPA